ncbi:MAG: EAL domain-containing protein [Desulfobacterales bacterium]|nr:EAL domain-containing protein [Desulfobacterales bacterium]
MVTDACVLVVDDIATNRRILVRHLEKQGVKHIIEAEDGRQALEILHSQPVDLVLLDVMMPQMDGYEVLNHMRADETLHRLPVIMITALDDMDSAVRCIEAGAEDYVLKPFNSVLLRARVSACLEKKRLRDVEREYLRRYDIPTGLPNQDLFLSRLAEELKRRQKLPPLFGTLLVRLDRYRMIIDSLGQRAGDRFAVTMATRLTQALPGQAMIARLGPNEFAILLTHLAHATEATAIARHIHNELGKAMVLESHEVSGKVHVGVALSSTAYHRPEDMLRDAGLAANTAGQNQGYQVFDETMHRHAMHRLMLEPELERAVAENELVLHYQPIVDLDSRQITGFEALVRWQHPERGMVPPDEFIGLAEETGLIVPIGTYVLEEACRQAAQWNARMGEDRRITVGVNVSARQFAEPTFPEIVARACEAAGLNRNLLKLELTETAVIDNIDLVEQILQELKVMSVRAVLDDFGTGYCSLTYLHRFPFDGLKIDRSFVEGIDNRTKNREIVHSTIMLAHRLGMEVVAEGIEAEGEGGVLRQLGCKYGQGTLFGHSLPAEEAGRRLFGTDR